MVRRRKSEPGPFTANLNALMKEAGLTIAEAARIAQIPTSTLGDWRSGTNPDDFLAVQRLADHFNVSLAFLLTGKEDKRDTSTIPPISAVFNDGGLLFDGIAHITVRRLIHRKDSGGSGENQS